MEENHGETAVLGAARLSLSDQRQIKEALAMSPSKRLAALSALPRTLRAAALDQLYVDYQRSLKRRVRAFRWGMWFAIFGAVYNGVLVLAAAVIGYWDRFGTQSIPMVGCAGFAVWCRWNLNKKITLGDGDAK